nr:Chain C, GAG PEPTIDE [synthetic construct]
SLYNVVATL